MAQTASCWLRSWKRRTRWGRSMLEPGSRGALQALLFRHAFWHADISQFVSGRPRKLPGWWPQGDIGAVLWSMSAVATDWQNAATLTALCTVPDDKMPTAAHWSPAATMFAPPHPRSAALVWAGGVSGAGGLVRRSVAQDRALRPLPVVRCPVRGQPRDGALEGMVRRSPRSCVVGRSGVIPSWPERRRGVWRHWSPDG